MPIFESFFSHAYSHHEDERGDEAGSRERRERSDRQYNGEEEIEVCNSPELLKQSFVVDIQFEG